MKISQNYSKKKLYSTPEITHIKVDTEISLVLQSQEPPAGPGESIGLHAASNHFNNDPFKNNLV